MERTRAAREKQTPQQQDEEEEADDLYRGVKDKLTKYVCVRVRVGVDDDLARVLLRATTNEQTHERMKGIALQECLNE